MSDVARRADVSESTVSRVLSGTKTSVTISDRTRERVLAVVDELSYQPHPFARALRGKRVNLIGLIAREIDDPFFAQLIEVISAEAKARGFDLVLGFAKSDPEEALALSEVLDLRQSDGLLLLGDLNETPGDRELLERMGRDRRTVSVCRGSDSLVGDTAWVDVDNRRGAFLVLDHLVGLGHGRIGLVTSGRVGDLAERVDAYTEFVSDRLGEVCADLIQRGENDFGGGYRAATRLLELPEPPTAIWAEDDMMALGALAAACDLGLCVPDDVSIAGYDDVRVAEYVRPSLTTVRQPIEELGARAIEILVDLIRAEEAVGPLPQVLLEPELVVRDSTARPPERRASTTASDGYRVDTGREVVPATM
jgi:DNA-binding LacI/PurR family transcriptional regulator